jgi:hypothetical protein
MLVRLAVKKIVEEAMEAAVRDLLGLRATTSAVAAGRAIGTATGKGRLKTSQGEVGYAVPQLRGVEAEPIARATGATLGTHRGMESWHRDVCGGCSTRDIEAVFRDAEGRALLSGRPSAR